MCDDPRWFDWAVEENVILLNNEAYIELGNQLDLADEDFENSNSLDYGDDAQFFTDTSV